MITQQHRQAHDELMRLERYRQTYYYNRGEKVPHWLREQLNVARAELREVLRIES